MSIMIKIHLVIVEKYLLVVANQNLIVLLELHMNYAIANFLKYNNLKLKLFN